MKNFCRPVSSQSGFSIIQGLVAIVILGLVMTAFMTLVSNMNSEISTGNARVAASALNQDVRTALSVNGICKAAMANVTIPQSSRTAHGRVGFEPNGINISTVGVLKAGPKAPTYSVGLNDVYLTNFLPVSGTTSYLADFVIEPTVPGSKLVLHPAVAAKLVLELNSSGLVIDCGVDGSSNQPQLCNMPPSANVCTPQYASVSGGYRVQTNNTCVCSVRYFDSKYCYTCNTSAGGGGGGSGGGGHGGSGNGHGGLGGSASDH